MTRDKKQNSITQLNKTLPKPIELNDGETLESHKQHHLSHITDVLIGENHLIKGENGGLPYTVWQVKVIINDLNFSSIILYKRYTDFVKLKQDLDTHFKQDHVVIPELPAKDSFSINRIMLSKSWLEDRRKGLQWFLSNVLLNPTFQNSVYVKNFVLNK